MGKDFIQKSFTVISHVIFLTWRDCIPVLDVTKTKNSALNMTNNHIQS